eukprot:SM000089S23802  [mRNA]  locus=s89:54439:59931:- [translate_table: standard]
MARRRRHGGIATVAVASASAVPSEPAPQRHTPSQLAALPAGAPEAERRQRRRRRRRYETELLPAAREGDPAVAEAEAGFFADLDRQLNKVSKFYIAKESEYVARARRLYSQLEALKGMRYALEEQTASEPPEDDEQYIAKLDELDARFSFRADGVREGSQLGISGADEAFPSLLPQADQVAPASINGDGGGLSSSVAGSPTPSQQQALPLRNEVSPAKQQPIMQQSKTRGLDLKLQSEPTEGREEDSGDAEVVVQEGMQQPFGNDKSVPRTSSSAIKKFKLDIPATKPRETIQKLSKIVWESRYREEKELKDSKAAAAYIREDLAISRKEVKQADSMLRKALIEFYRGLRLLSNYSSLNTAAFGKILKKHDKIPDLMKSLESVYTTYFAGNDHRLAMSQLRPLYVHASHTVSFLIGKCCFLRASWFFFGTCVALGVAFVALLVQAGGYSAAGGASYLDSVFPIFGSLALVLLHSYLYGWNVWLWRRTRINYAFIFEFAPGTELRYREVLLISSCLNVILLGGMVIHLVVHARAFDRHNASELVPLFTLLLFLAILINPFNFCYRSSRAFLLRTLLHCICAPLYKVVLADFFLADQLCSQVPMLRGLEYAACYYGGGYFESRNSRACTGNTLYRVLAFGVTILPYWCRMMQCLRRYTDEKDTMHLYNCGKYLSAVISVALRLLHTFSPTPSSFILTIISAIIATIYQSYWDLCIDWGLLHSKSSNPWLRDQLTLKSKSAYFVAMVVNVLLRFAWLQTVTRFHFGSLNPNIANYLFAALEVLRRGIWNFFRLENEHLNNVGRFRAVKTVPLPFRDLEESEV